MVNPDLDFDYHRYRNLLAEAIDETKRRALIDLLIEEQAKDRLEARRACEQKAMTTANIAEVLSRGPHLAKEGVASINSAELSTSAIDDDLDIFHFPAAAAD
jgi:hypothetical protein